MLDWYSRTLTWLCTLIMNLVHLWEDVFGQLGVFLFSLDFRKHLINLRRFCFLKGLFSFCVSFFDSLKQFDVIFLSKFIPTFMEGVDIVKMLLIDFLLTTQVFCLLGQFALNISNNSLFLIFNNLSDFTINCLYLRNLVLTFMFNFFLVRNILLLRLGHLCLQNLGLLKFNSQ